MPETLIDLPVLVVDCQSTGANPERGHLLEVAWYASRAGEEAVRSAGIRSTLVELPGGVEIPFAVTRITGISRGAMAHAASRRRVWSLLGRAAAALIVPGRDDTPCVAHHARFEARFLEHLHREQSPGSPFPFRWRCTHEIARRLYPDLPRRGLRALAGFLGHPLSESKRAADHVRATAWIWSHLARELCARGVASEEDLQRFLDERPPPRGSRWSYPLSRERRLALPHAPGVYRFRGGGGKVLYVGKAASLHSRVNSYYRRRKGAEKILEMVSQARDVEVTATRSCLEAALLENEEIKRLDPPYNRALRDRGQGVWYYSRDLRDAGRVPDRRHPLGPVPATEPFRILRTLRALLTRIPRDPEEERRALAALHVTRDPAEPGALAGALTALVQEHALTAAPAGGGSLLALGSRLLRERALIGVSGNDSLPEKTSDRPPIPSENPGSAPLDTPALVARLEEAVALAARLVRRGRWLAAISESTLCWRNADGDHRSALVFREGEPVDVRRLEPHEKPPPPPDAGGAGRRRSAMRRAAYDRLRVLSTELKRLVEEGREVEVLFGPDHRLRGHRLRTLLRTV